jgi:CRP-like cAMP-binding protein
MRITKSEKTVQYYVDRFEMATFLNDRLLDALRPFHFPAYASIYIEQDEQHFLYFLVEGQVQCNHYHPNGKLAVFAVVTPFAAIGDIEILHNDPVHSNVIATTDTTLLGIEAVFVQRYGAEDPRFLRFLIDQIRTKLYQTNTMQINQILPVIHRLALYMLSRPAEQDFITLPDKSDLASLMGATVRHLNRVLKEMVEMAYISDSYPRVRILDRQALEDLSS